MDEELATCVWVLRRELLVALHGRLGVPDDPYPNGNQTWLRPDGPDGVPIEWRLHPVPSFTRPGALRSHELFPAVAGALARGQDPPLDPGATWTGLVAFPAYGDRVEPDTLASVLGAVLGLAPDAHGLVDHGELGRTWERSGGTLDVIAEILTGLG